MFVFVVLCVLFYHRSDVHAFSLVRTGQECGVEASSNLVHHNPWLVLLEYYRGDRQLEVRCGGTLIDSRHVVTAAHCVNKKFSRLSVRLGDYDLTADPDCVGELCTGPVVRIDVDVFAHPDYDGTEHDIAVLRLKEDAPYTDFIRPVCLPSGKLEEGATLSASGWGEIPNTGEYSKVKKILPLPVWDVEKCRGVYKKSKLPKHIICAGGEIGMDTCRGDSGGPLTWIKQRTELWGITSSGSMHCGMQGMPGIYTSVIDHLDWINEIIKAK